MHKTPTQHAHKKTVVQFLFAHLGVPALPDIIYDLPSQNKLSVEYKPNESRWLAVWLHQDKIASH